MNHEAAARGFHGWSLLVVSMCFSIQVKGAMHVRTL